MDIRPLQVKDVFKLAAMLGKITKGARIELARLLASEKPNPTEVGIVLFQSVFMEAEEDLEAWLADLVGKEKADFETMPASTVLDIVEKLIAQEDIRDFFGRASRLLTSKTD